jgi:hypothetical protein
MVIGGHCGQFSSLMVFCFNRQRAVGEWVGASTYENTGSLFSVSDLVQKYPWFEFSRRGQSLKHIRTKTV